jgi:Right handed beta helix region
MKRLMMLMLVALAVPATAFAATSGGSASTTCTPTGFQRDGINLTAAQIGGKVTGDLDATGCDIGVYYGPGAKGSVKNATIENAKYFGVVNYRGKVNVTNSTISQIGNTPLDGTQHGVGIFYTTEETPGGAISGNAKGTISGNILHSYQKGGITVRGAGSSARIVHNTLTGSGHVADIAQNGIQVSFGGSATVKGNTVSGHWYTPDSTEACGLLFYQAGTVKATANTLFDNEMEMFVGP